MQRPGLDESNVQPEDFLCDYCGNHWAPDRPMVEGHRGSLLCGSCLTLAYTQVIVQKAGVVTQPAVTCSLCLEHHDTLHWQGPAAGGPVACERCIQNSARMMEKDRDTTWSRPQAPAK